MPPISREAFADLFAGLDPAEARQFVADLYAARGWDTHVEERVVVAERDGDTRRFALDAREGAERLPPEEVHSLALFAVDREVCARLFRTYFDRPLPTDGPAWTVDPPAPTPATDRSENGSPDSVRTRLPSLAVVGVVLGVLLAGGAAGYVAFAGDAPGVSPASGTSGDSPPAGDGSTDEEPSRTAADPDAMDDAPPGLRLDRGITDADRLAAAHARAVEDDSYTWTITVRLSDGGDRSLRRETVRVAGPDSYATTIERVGNDSGASAFVAADAVYADGETEWIHRGERRCRSAVGGSRRFATRAERYIGWLLSVNESWIFDRFTRNGSTYYSVQFRGDPWPGDRNVSGSVLLDARGRVHALRRVGALPTGEQVSITLQYRRFGATTVEAPAWYDRTRASGDCDRDTYA